MGRAPPPACRVAASIVAMSRSPATRRVLLAGGLASLAGCALDQPTVTPRAPRPATPGSTPAVVPALLALARQEEAVATWLAGLPLVTAAGSAVPAALVPTLVSLRDAHRAHAALLGRTDPLVPQAAPSGATSPAPRVTGDWSALAPELARREAGLAAAHRAAALGATDGDLVLLASGLAAFASAARTPSVPVATTTAVPGSVDVGTRTTALGVLLETLRALAEGLQVGAGRLPLPHPLHAPARTRLDAVWTQRDRVQAQLVALGAPVPPARTSYRMPGTFATPADVQHTWGGLETAVLNAWGRLAAASTGQDRAAAVDAMAAQARAVTATGTGLARWPGWA